MPFSCSSSTNFVCIFSIISSVSASLSLCPPAQCTVQPNIESTVVHLLYCFALHPYDLQMPTSVAWWPFYEEYLVQKALKWSYLFILSSWAFMCFFSSYDSTEMMVNSNGTMFTRFSSIRFKCLSSRSALSIWPTARRAPNSLTSLLSIPLYCMARLKRVFS